MKTWTSHRKEVKEYAKKSLIGLYLKGVIAALVSFIALTVALYFIPLKLPAIQTSETTLKEVLLSMIPSGHLKETIALCAIAFLLYLLISSPLEIGIRRFYLLAVREEKPKFSVIFSSFASLREVFSACALNLMSIIILGLLAVLLFAAPIWLHLYAPTLGPLAKTAGMVCGILAALVFFILSVPFSFAPYLLAERPERGVFKSIFMAIKRMRGAKIEYIVFALSFTLWRLVFGSSMFGTFLIDPYLSASNARFFDTVNECKNK